MADSFNPNDAQAQRVARLMADAFKADTQPQTSRWVGSAPAWIALLVSLAGIVWQAAVTTGRVNDNTRRVEQVERDQRAQQADSRVVIERLARIEAKLDLITETKQ